MFREGCKVPRSAWFDNEGAARRNVERKWEAYGEIWYYWRDGDHYHVRPRNHWEQAGRNDVST